MQETIQVCNKLSLAHPAFVELLLLWILTETNSLYRFKLIQHLNDSVRFSLLLKRV